MPTTVRLLTLEDLYRHGDFAVTESHTEVIIDITIRRSGMTLYGCGSTLGVALSDLTRELEEHFDALDHLEDQGINVGDLWRYVDQPGRPDTRVDSDIYSLPPMETFPTEAPVTAVAAEPIDNGIDTDSPGYVLALLIPVREGRA